MAGKTISQADLAGAVARYCAASGKDSSIGEDGKIRIFQGSPGDNDALLWLEGGKVCDNRGGETQLDLIDYWPSVSPVNGRSQMDKAIMPSNGRKAGNGALVKPGAAVAATGPAMIKKTGALV